MIDNIIANMNYWATVPCTAPLAEVAEANQWLAYYREELKRTGSEVKWNSATKTYQLL